jgi:hypothetical protein
LIYRLKYFCVFARSEWRFPGHAAEIPCIIPTEKKFATSLSTPALRGPGLPSQKSSCNVKYMQSDCHRCGHPLEGQLAFCPACGAPQIRVSRAIETSQEETIASDSGLPAPSLPVSALSSELSTTAGIDWKYFLRTAIPLAVLTDVLTMTLHPLALFVLLPANLVWAISRYRRHRPVTIGRGQGARMGAMMGLLSFTFFLAFFLVSISFQRTQYRDIMVTQIHQISAQNPDPQAQQMLQWFATPEGLITFTAIALVMILIVCLALGSGSGALVGALRKEKRQL